MKRKEIWKPVRRRKDKGVKRDTTARQEREAKEIKEGILAILLEL